MAENQSKTSVMTPEENNHLLREAEKKELELYDNLTDRHIQIKILKATERTAKNVAFYFWVSVISAVLWCLFWSMAGAAFI